MIIYVVKLLNFLIAHSGFGVIAQLQFNLAAAMLGGGIGRVVAEHISIAQLIIYFCQCFAIVRRICREESSPRLIGQFLEEVTVFGGGQNIYISSSSGLLSHLAQL